MRKACEHDVDAITIHFACAERIACREIYNKKASSLLLLIAKNQQCQITVGNGYFDPVWSQHRNLVKLLVYTSDSTGIIAVTDIQQLTCCQDGSSHTLRHRQERQIPLPLYLGVINTSKTCNKELVDALFELGLCTFYNHVMSISTSLGNNYRHYFEMEKAVCPPKLKGELFTTASIDNIDYNPSSTTARDSFHGTGIFLVKYS